MITMLIADENVIAMNHLRSVVEMLESNGEHNYSIKCFDRPEALLHHVRRFPDRADIVFLDLGFHHGKELQIAKELHRLQKRVQLVFTSRKGFFQPDIYEIPHVYYLDKPIIPHLTALALERARENLEEDRSDSLPVITKKRRDFVRIKDILYLEKELRMIHIYTSKRRYSVYGRFADVLPYLKGYFIQCHQSYMVSLLWIDRLENNMFHLRDERRIPISQRRLTYCKRRTEEYFHQ